MIYIYYNDGGFNMTNILFFCFRKKMAIKLSDAEEGESERRLISAMMREIKSELLIAQMKIIIYNMYKERLIIYAIFTSENYICSQIVFYIFVII